MRVDHVEKYRLPKNLQEKEDDQEGGEKDFSNLSFPVMRGSLVLSPFLPHCRSRARFLPSSSLDIPLDVQKTPRESGGLGW